MSKLPVYFAPLQGYTEAAYRNAHAEIFGGVETYFTPFVRLEHGNFRNKDLRDIEPHNNKVPQLIPQLIGNSKEKAERIVSLLVEKGYKEININLGCPFPLLAKKRNGSGMLPFPEEVSAFMSIVQDHPDITFSVKMRLGWEQPEECLALIPLFNELPLKQIIMHPRVGKQQYKGDVDLAGFAAFAENCRHSLIYNGDLKTRESIEQIQNAFPSIGGVMIGRGLLENPALAWEYQNEKKLASSEIKEKLHQMHGKVFAHYQEQMQGGDAQLVHKMKTFWEYLEPLIGHKAWKGIHKSTNLDKYRTAVRSITY